jgi:hypothetical protein
MPNAHSLRIDPSPQVLNNASGGIGHHFLGFGIETASFPDYTSIHIFKTVTYLSLLTVLGNKLHPNNFSLNMFSTIANRTESPLPIRVGGTSMYVNALHP